MESGSLKPWDRLIGSKVQGLSFADVGGLWGTVNEKVSIALKAGARSATMIDIEPAGSALWQAFHDRCAAEGVSSYATYTGNVDDPSLWEKVGTFDMLHCSGVIYHVPNPVLTVERLRALTNRYLLLGSMTVPPVMENVAGILRFPPGMCCFLPALDRGGQMIVGEHFKRLKVKVHNIGDGPAVPWRKPDGSPRYGPWWWLWTAVTLAELVRSAGFQVHETIETWPGRAHVVFAERA